jgi:hypothetical protein
MDDIEDFVTILEEAHADPYRKISKQRFTRIKKNLKHRIETLKTDQVSIFDCYYFLQELTASIQDEHTLIFPYQSQNDSFSNLPFAIKIIKGKVFIVKKWEKVPMPLSSEILEINNIAMRRIIAKCWRFLSPPLRHSKGVMFERIISEFLQTYFRMKSPWIITYKHESQIHKAEIKGISSEKGQSPFMSELSLQYNVSAFNIDKEKIPILEIPSFSYGDEQVYEDFIDNFFRSHYDSNYLVIDLRRNPGGSGYRGIYLLDYLTNSRYPIWDSFFIKMSELFRRSEYSFKAGKQIDKAKNGSYIESVEDKLHIPHKKNEKFRGKVFLLTSHYTGSAAVVMAAIFKFNKMGTIIGQETFGRKRFCSDPAFIKLHNSKLYATIPLAIMTLGGKNPDRGIISDIKVNYTLKDHINGRDKEIDQIKEIIRTVGTY